MELSQPKPKKNCRLKPDQDLPVLNSGHRYKGVFNGFGVVIHDPTDMEKLVSMGYFGKATLSRNYPDFHKRTIIRKRVFENRKNLASKSNKKPTKVVVIPDSDTSDTETLDEYLTNLKPQYQLDHSGLSETVNLTLEESFFLQSALDCLDISHTGKPLSLEDTWELFRTTDKHFVVNYVVYYYFRAKNWVVKPGIKFGGDFLLYKQGPPFFHASYVVIVNVVDQDLKRIDGLNRRTGKMSGLTGLQRLCETAAKELLICDVIWPQNLPTPTFQDISKFTIKETIMKRWTPSLKR